MKILYLEHPEADYGSYYLYNGLCEALGEDDIVSYPAKLSYLGLCDKYYTLDDRKRGCTHPPSYLKPRNNKIWTLEEIFDQMETFDAMVLSSPRTYAIRALKFIKKYYDKKLPKLIFCDHEDSEQLRKDIIDEFNPDIIFKREMFRPMQYVHKTIYPLPFSSTIPYLSKQYNDQEKNLNIFASFGLTWSFRKEAVDFLIDNYGHENNYLNIDDPRDKAMFPERYPKNMLSYDEYLTKLASSKIGISIRGHGADCVRYFEISAFETLFMVQDPGIIIPHPFEDKKHCVYFDGTDDLKEKIDYYLSHDEERITIAKAGKEHLHEYHTNLKRAEQFIEIVKRQI